MPTATIIANVVHLTIFPGSKYELNLTMSLQRHHYRYCAAGHALPMNSLLHASVRDADVLSDVQEVGEQIEKLLNNNHRAQKLFGHQLRCKSGRVYLVDNSALKPNGFPNHFFPTSGPALWDRMSQAEYAAASAIRRLEEIIDAQPSHLQGQFLDGHKLHAIHPGKGQHPVVLAFTAARTALLAAPHATQKLGLLSSKLNLVELAKDF